MASPGETYFQSNLNEKKHKIAIGENKLCLEIGSIINTEADAIVNSTQPNLDLNCGALSQAILKAAGKGIQDECQLIYPKGITIDDVAVTSGGELAYIENIFHVTSNNYTNDVACVLAVERIVNNCLNELIDNNLDSISFPALGTGSLKYPIEIVAHTMVSTCYNFLNNNKNYGCSINLVISDEFPDILRVFESEFSKLIRHHFKQDVDLHIQWKYEIKPDKWLDFPLYICSQIELAFNQKKSDVQFVNEENVVSIIWFESMIYSELEESITSYKVKRHVHREDVITYPSTWSRMSENLDFCLIELDDSSPEYNEVYKDFKSKINEIEVVYARIQRVQCKSLYEAYLTYKKRLRNRIFNENEMNLWHGTKNESVESICKLGFNRSFCGVNGVKFGKGVYFAVTSSYSHKFTDTESDFNERKIFRAKVLVGEATIGNENTKHPPLKGNGDHYDSTCDPSKSIFVSYHDSQCYPEYLISYTTFE